MKERQKGIGASGAGILCSVNHQFITDFMKPHFYKILVIILLFSLIGLGVFTLSLLHRIKPIQPLSLSILPSPTNSPTSPPFPPFKPSAFFGPQTQIEGIDKIFTNKYFTLKVKYENQPEQTFRVSLNDADNVSDVQIAPGEKYGCATVQASGYIGYLIFSLPAGHNISSGEEYSACLDWVNNHQVIISEHIYNTKLSSYYLLDANTNKRQYLGSYNTTTHSAP